MSKLTWTLPGEEDEAVGCGQSGYVQLVPGRSDAVRKSVLPWADEYRAKGQREQLRREIAIYRHLPDSHPRLVRMLAYEEGEAEDEEMGKENEEVVNEKDEKDEKDEVSLTLEYMPKGCLSAYLFGGSPYVNPNPEDLARGAAIPRRQRASWALEATDGLALLHAYDVLHADFKPKNMVLDEQLRLRIIDLSGSSLCGLQPLTLESTPFFLPRNWGVDAPPEEVCNVQTDLFALGSSLFQIATCFVPWYELWAKRDDTELENRYRRGEFPDLTVAGPDGKAPLQFGTVIDRCWHTKMGSAQEALEMLKAEIRKDFGPEDRAWIEQQSRLSLDEAGNGGSTEGKAD